MSVEQNSENVKHWKIEWNPADSATVRRVDDHFLFDAFFFNEDGPDALERAVAAVNAHAALEARIAALEDALQEVDDLARDCTYYEFGERYEEGMASKVGTLLQSGGAQ